MAPCRKLSIVFPVLLLFALIVFFLHLVHTNSKLKMQVIAAITARDSLSFEYNKKMAQIALALRQDSIKNTNMVALVALLRQTLGQTANERDSLDSTLNEAKNKLAAEIAWSQELRSDIAALTAELGEEKQKKNSAESQLASIQERYRKLLQANDSLEPIINTQKASP